jgi:thiol:disulfide interchange protein DsbD
MDRRHTFITSQKIFFKNFKYLFTPLLFWIILGTLVSPLANGLDTNKNQSKILNAKQVFTITAHALNKENKMKLNFLIAPGHVLYRDSFKFRTLQGAPLDNMSTILPAAQIKRDEVMGDSQVYTKQLILNVPLPTAKNQTPVGFRIQYQGCSDNGFCYPPITKIIQYDTKRGILISEIAAEQFAEVGIENAVLTASQPDSSNTTMLSTTQSSVEAASDFLTNQLKTGAFPITFLLFLGLGILLSFTPCILPMVPILANILVGHDTPLSSRRAILLASVYVLSVAICYAVAGVIAGLMGSYLQVALQQPMILTGFSFVILLFALSQLDVIHFQLPSFFTNTLHQIQHKQKQGSVFGAFAMGVISALVVSPCVTPALVGALSYIGQTGNAILGGLALFALALGMSLPLLAVACVGSHYLPKAGPWMNYIKILTGILLLILAGFFWMRAFPATENTSVAKRMPTHFTAIYSKADLQSAFKAAKSSGKSIILDVYADWCASCQKIDKEVFTNNTVISTLKNVTLLRLDLTKQTQDSRQLQRELGIVGPPTVLFFRADGTENKNYRLVGKLQPNDFVEHLNHFFSNQNK